jgi:hypothetical protein
VIVLFAGSTIANPSFHQIANQLEEIRQRTLQQLTWALENRNVIDLSVNIQVRGSISFRSAPDRAGPHGQRLTPGLCVVQAPNVIVPQSFVEEGPILVIDLGKLSFKSGLTGGEKERNRRLAQADSSSSDNR